MFIVQFICMHFPFILSSISVEKATILERGGEGLKPVVVFDHLSAMTERLHKDIQYMQKYAHVEEYPRCFLHTLPNRFLDEFWHMFQTRSFWIGFHTTRVSSFASHFRHKSRQETGALLEEYGGLFALWIFIYFHYCSMTLHLLHLTIFPFYAVVF